MKDIMRGQNPFIAVGLAGLAAGLALFVASKASASAGSDGITRTQTDAQGKPVPLANQDEQSKE